MVHIDRELEALSRIQSGHRADTWRATVDHWLDRRLDLTAPYRPRKDT